MILGLACALGAPTALAEELARDGEHARIETERGPVHVWTPAGYDPSTAITVVFVHGYRTEVDEAWVRFRLPEQFALSGLNAMFVVPAAPSGKDAPLVWPSLHALLATVTVHLGVRMPTRRLVAVGHSGAYRTLVSWLDSPKLDALVLLDAVYGEYRFARWVRANKRRRLINIAYETARFSERMHRALPETRRVDGLPREGFPDARIVYARTDAGHWSLVTDGVALPLALRAIGGARVTTRERPLGLPPVEQN